MSTQKKQGPQTLDQWHKQLEQKRRENLAKERRKEKELRDSHFFRNRPKKNTSGT